MSATAPLQLDRAASPSLLTSVPSMEHDMQVLKEKHEASSFPKDNHRAQGKLDSLFGERMSIWVAGYWASLIRVGIMIPSISSVILVFLYLSFPDLVKLVPIFHLDSTSKWELVALADLSTLLLWLGVAWFCHPLTNVRTANPSNYGLLSSRLCQLRAKLRISVSEDELETVGSIHADVKEAVKRIRYNNESMKYLTNRDPMAWNEALCCYIDIHKLLCLTPNSLLWAFGSGYCVVWSLLHQAEEALIECEDINDIIGGAIYDKLAIQGTKMNTKDELLDKLTRVVNVLQPVAAEYFGKGQPKMDSAHPNANEEASARAALRQVRKALNSLRDRSWEGILRARNRLLASIAITGMATHILLGIAILTTSDSQAMMAATVFYLVGAVIGLFRRFYHESVGGTTSEDFGFSTVRLVATPLLSGLAGIGGVMLATIGQSVLMHGSGSMYLSDIFNLTPEHLLVAAIFGLAPNRLLTGLQNAAKKYEGQIRSSKGAATSTD